MFRRIKDFSRSWEHEVESTLKVLRGLTDQSLSTPVVEGGRTLGFLAGHLTGSMAAFGASVGIDLGEAAAAAGSSAAGASELALAYESAAKALLAEVEGWTDESLTDKVSVFGQEMPRGVLLYVVILHQAHHRGQMTVLMRQAEVPVPGVYGPSKADWEAMGQPAME